MNTCLMSGSVANASLPSIDELTGTLRRCINVKPSRSISSIITLSICDCSFSSFGKNINPVPYFPFSGTGIPCSKINSCGICKRMPAPSPVFPSAPSAPLCRMFSSTFSALSTSSWLLFPLMFTTIPTPQASCSFSGLYSPTCFDVLFTFICSRCFVKLLSIYLFWMQNYKELLNYIYKCKQKLYILFIFLHFDGYLCHFDIRDNRTGIQNLIFFNCCI